LRQSKRDDPTLSGASLCHLVAERYGVELHKRTVEKAVASGVPRQKKTKRHGKRPTKRKRRPRRRRNS
jgi:hypothetical protein